MSVWLWRKIQTVLPMKRAAFILLILLTCQTSFATVSAIRNGSGEGHAFAVESDADGSSWVTAKHCVDKPGQISIFHSGRWYAGRLAWSSRNDDSAVVYVPKLSVSSTLTLSDRRPPAGKSAELITTRRTLKLTISKVDAGELWYTSGPNDEITGTFSGDSGAPIVATTKEGQRVVVAIHNGKTAILQQSGFGPMRSHGSRPLNCLQWLRAVSPSCLCPRTQQQPFQPVRTRAVPRPTTRTISNTNCDPATITADVLRRIESTLVNRDRIIDAKIQKAKQDPAATASEVLQRIKPTLETLANRDRIMSGKLGQLPDAAATAAEVLQRIEPTLERRDRTIFDRLGRLTSTIGSIKGSSESNGSGSKIGAAVDIVGTGVATVNPLAGAAIKYGLPTAIGLIGSVGGWMFGRRKKKGLVATPTNTTPTNTTPTDTTEDTTTKTGTDADKRQESNTFHDERPDLSPSDSPIQPTPRPEIPVDTGLRRYMRDKDIGDGRKGAAVERHEQDDWFRWAEENGLRPAELADRWRDYDLALKDLPADIEAEIREHIDEQFVYHVADIPTPNRTTAVCHALRSLAAERALEDTRHQNEAATVRRYVTNRTARKLEGANT